MLQIEVLHFLLFLFFQLVQAIQFLHDLGAAQFFDTEFLRSLVVIYPQWIVDVMACLVTVHQGIVKVKEVKVTDTYLRSWITDWIIQFWMTHFINTSDISCHNLLWVVDIIASIVTAYQGIFKVRIKVKDTEISFLSNWPVVLSFKHLIIYRLM